MASRNTRKAIVQPDLPTRRKISKYAQKRKATSGKDLSSAETRNCDEPLIPGETLDDKSTPDSNCHFGSSLPRDVNSSDSSQLLSHRCDSSFYDVPCKDLAKRLLGCVLVRRLADGTVLRGRIVETECYLGGEDKASHSYNGRMTERSKPMFMDPGTAYVYMTYGMYHCFNISSRGPGAAVLLRALEPLQGLDFMLSQRLASRKKPRQPDNNQDDNGPPPKKTKTLKPHELCNGPAKLCTSLLVEKASCNARDLVQWEGMWIERGEGGSVHESLVVETSRIGIDSAGVEWASKPLRFYVVGSESVSRRDLVAEKKVKELAGNK